MFILCSLYSVKERGSCRGGEVSTGVETSNRCVLSSVGHSVELMEMVVITLSSLSSIVSSVYKVITVPPPP